VVEYLIRCFDLMFALCRYVSETRQCCSIKKKGEKKKVKSNVTWHIIECDGSVKKIDSKVPVYNQFRLRRSRMTCYFGAQPKAGAPGTV